MEVRFNFNLEAWVDGVAVEAKSEDEALEKLRQMTVEEMLNAGGYEKNSSVTQVNSEITEATYEVKTSEVLYDIADLDVYEAVAKEHPEVDESSEEFDSLVDDKIIAIKESLPQEMTFEVTCAPNDLDSVVADEVSTKVGWLVDFVEYDIVKIS